MTTNWVRTDAYSGFPLMHHWRILPDSPPKGFADELGGIDGAVTHWDASPAVRRRLEAISQSSSSLVLFLEYLPQTLASWLKDQRRAATAANSDGSLYSWVDAALARGTAFMSARGLVHFDAHFDNILTDGHRIYFADFGLALHSGFELSADETDFLSKHRAYDRCHTAHHLLRHHLPDDIRGNTDHEAFLRGWIEGRRPDGVQPEIAAIIDLHARSAAILDDFYRRFLTQNKRTPFPSADIEQACLADPQLSDVQRR